MGVRDFDPANASDRMLAAIVESSDDAIIGKTLEGVIVTWNAAAERLYGYRADEVQGRSIDLLVPAPQSDQLQGILQSVSEGRRTDHLETIRKTKDGRLIDVALTVTPIRDLSGHVIGAATIARDLTAHKKRERALRASEERWRAVIESAVDGIVLIDEHGRIEAFNAAAERLFGYVEGEVVGRNVSVLMPAPYCDEHDNYLARYLATGQSQIIGTGREVSGRRRDGTTFPMHLSVGEVRVDGERRFTGIVHDLTQRDLLTRRLTASEARWRSVIESAVDAIILIDSRGSVEAFNNSAERLFGYRESEIIGENVSKLMPQPDQARHDDYLNRYLETGEQRIIGIGREVLAMRRDGTTFPAQLSVGEMVVNGERKFTGIVHDLTDRVRIEAQLREQSTMARLGEMAAVVAHEVKNPLAGIRGAVQVLGSRMAPESRDASVAHQIVARIDGLNEFVNDLLLFSRPATLRLTRLDLADVVAGTVAIFAQDQSMSEVRIETGGAAPPVMGDVELLKIVITNLIVNGAQAMERHGLVHVALRGEGSYAELIVRDTGPGIPAEARANVFTPFYTTKVRGTGLGLPTAKRLVEAHRGFIELTCPDDGGTLVTIRLPIAP